MKLRLQTKATLAIALLVIFVLTTSSYLFYDAAERALDAEMGERLVAISKAVATQMQFLTALEPGGEQTRLYQSLRRKLQVTREASEARAIYVFDLEGKNLVDSREDVPIGSRYRFLDADRIHIEQAEKGTAAASVTFSGKDGALYKTAYAPVRDESGNIIAIVAVDASVLFLETLDRMERNMRLIGVVGIVFAVILSILFSRSIVVPVQKLSQAAQQIKAGDFGTQVETHRGDEVGVLAEAFNEMSIAIQERDHKLSRLAEELRQMSAGLAHEVRNPLNGMRIFLGLLKRQTAQDPKAEKLIEQVDGEVQSLNQLVTEFLDFARPAPLQREAVTFSNVVDSVTALLGGELDENGVEVQTLGLDRLPVIEADAEQLKWAFTNLVKNAAQAMPDGGTLTISGEAVPTKNRVQIKIRDTGIGMTDEVAERVFDPFFTTKDTGTGLGLAIVKRFIEAHRGTIECSSQEGRGTTFTIILPIANRLG
jgi:two-component system, sporulation sensor kinase E